MSDPTITDYAKQRTIDLYNNHPNECGSKYTGDRTGKTATDCITYVKNALTFAYQQSGKPDVASKIRGLTEGMPLAKYLASIGWLVHYWNPDVKQPRDSMSEHPFGYQQAIKTGLYYGLRVSGYVINYYLTSKPVPPSAKVYNRLKQVGFAFGIARGGEHTFIYSEGSVYEVHWKNIGADLYEKTEFYRWPWLSGVLLTPPDSFFKSDPPPGPWNVNLPPPGKPWW